MKPVIDHGFDHGMWSLVDVVSHLEAVIAQHPDPETRQQMHQEFKSVERSLASSLIPMLRDFEQRYESEPEVLDD